MAPLSFAVTWQSVCVDTYQASGVMRRCDGHHRPRSLLAQWQAALVVVARNHIHDINREVNGL